LIVWYAWCSITRSITRSIARFVAIARTFKGKAETAVCISMLFPLAIDGSVIIVRASSTPPLLRLNDFTLPAVIVATFLFARSFVLTHAHLFALSLLFLSLFSFPLFLLALLPVEAKKCSSRTEASSCNLRGARETVVAVFLIFALALTAVVVSFAVAIIAILPWTIAVAITVVIFVASAVLLALRFLWIFAISLRILRVSYDVSAIAVGKARVPGSISVASFEAVITAASAISICAVTSYSEASPGYTAVFVMPGCALSTFVVAWLATIVVVLIISFSRAVLMHSLSSASVG
jgi:hypothetical protein